MIDDIAVSAISGLLGGGVISVLVTHLTRRAELRDTWRREKLTSAAAGFLRAADSHIHCAQDSFRAYQAAYATGDTNEEHLEAPFENVENSFHAMEIRSVELLVVTGYRSRLPTTAFVDAMWELSMSIHETSEKWIEVRQKVRKAREDLVDGVRSDLDPSLRRFHKRGR